MQVYRCHGGGRGSSFHSREAPAPGFACLVFRCSGGSECLVGAPQRLFRLLQLFLGALSIDFELPELPFEHGDAVTGSRFLIAQIIHHQDRIRRRRIEPVPVALARFGVLAFRARTLDLVQRAELNVVRGDEAKFRIAEIGGFARIDARRRLRRVLALGARLVEELHNASSPLLVALGGIRLGRRLGLGRCYARDERCLREGSARAEER